MRYEEHGLVASANMLVLARETSGLTQTALASALSNRAGSRVTQGYVSRAEAGDLPVSGERLQWFSDVLGVEASLLVTEAKVWALGDGCIYHRRKASARATALRRLHARLNLTLLTIKRLAGHLDHPLPGFALSPLAIEGAVGVNDAAAAVRTRLAVPSGPIASLTGMVESSGALILRARWGDREVDGASLHPPGEAPLFVLNADAPADRQRFTLSHELGHTAVSTAPDTDAESTADRFSSELLMPASMIRAELKASPLNLARLRQLKARWRVSAAALARRALDLGVLTESEHRSLVIDMSRLGWRRNEPDPLAPDLPRVVPQLIASAVSRFGGWDGAAKAAGLRSAVFAELLGTDRVLAETAGCVDE